ncbi:mannitol-1-phosphate 5-dehydrogenase [Alicyclobacillus curvatus]|nr:mannitol-1-phosphate 5-dehydrogenase [Alicyclobacillus curvatus]
MKKAVHFGAGNIGRGFIGLLLHKADYEVVFADVVPALVEDIDTAREYRVITLDAQVEEERVSSVRAVMLDSTECRQEIVSADVVTTAVGLANLNSVATVIADGLVIRSQQAPDSTLNILACENAVRATSALKAAVLSHLNPVVQDWVLSHVGFPDVAVDRIAPNRAGYASQPLDAVVERFFEWDIEKPGLMASIEIPGATFVEDLDMFLERKLFILNGAHATAAYAGFHRGHKTVLEAMQDDYITQLVAAVQQEAAEGLVKRHAGLNLPGLFAYAASVRARFLNPHIHDDVDRVGRDPLRKLSANDRLVLPLHFAHGAGIETPALVKAIAFGFSYDNPADPASVEIQQDIKSSGIESVVRRVTGITEQAVVDAIANQYKSLS